MYALLSELLNPLVLLLLALPTALAVLCWKPAGGRRRLWLVTLCLALLWFLSTPLAAHLALSTLERGYAPLQRRPEDAQAIVVLAGSLRPPNEQRSWTELECDTLRRCVEAERLYRQGKPIPVIVSGGKVDASRPGPTLAAAMAEFLHADGVEHVVEEGKSRNTYENAVETRAILRDLNLEHCVLVTDCTHMRRSVACFQAQGIDCVPSAVHCSTDEFPWEVTAVLPSPAAADSQRVVWHEWVGLLWYRLCGRI